MRLTRLSAALFIVLVLLTVLILTGCGGGGDQSGGNGSQGGNKAGGGEQGGGAQGNAPQVKIALGTIESVEPDKRRIVLQPSMEVQGGERMTFRVINSAKISLNNEPAEMADAKKGQQAQITYVVVNDTNRARAVNLISSGG